MSSGLEFLYEQPPHNSLKHSGFDSLKSCVNPSHMEVYHHLSRAFRSGHNNIDSRKVQSVMECQFLDHDILALKIINLNDVLYFRSTWQYRTASLVISTIRLLAGCHNGGPFSVKRPCENGEPFRTAMFRVWKCRNLRGNSRVNLTLKNEICSPSELSFRQALE